MIVVAVLGIGLVPADTPVLPADAAVGDGLFETTHVRAGTPWLLDAHLDRLQATAAAFELPLPSRSELVALVELACAAWDPAIEGAVRLVCPRGCAPVVTVRAVRAAQLRQRRDGCVVRTLPLGVAATARAGLAWWPAGKTLSYLPSLAAARWAAAVGVDDALWVSTDGYALEAQGASLVWLAGGTLYTVPPATTGILAGVTVRHLLDHAGALGYPAGERLVRPAELAGPAWLVSSVRGAAAIRLLDDRELSSSTLTEQINEVLGFVS